MVRTTPSIPHIRERTDVVGPRALGAFDGGCQIADSRRPLQEQLEGGAPQRIGHRPKLLRRRLDPQAIAIVIGNPVIV